MSSLLVSSKGQIVLPAALRRRLGLGAGSRLELSEQGDAILLRVVHAVAPQDVRALAGLVKARGRGTARHLEDFDSASMMRRSAKGRAP